MRWIPILLLALLLPLSAPAEETAPPASVAAPGGGIDAAKLEQWRTALLQAQERIEEARQEVDLAQRAFRDARRRNRRGEARGALLAELQDAQQELADAEAALPELLERARRAGVPRGVLRQFEG